MKWKVSPFFFCTVQFMVEESYSSMKSETEMSKNWYGCLILKCLSLLPLSQKPGKEGQVDRLISIYLDFSVIQSKLLSENNKVYATQI